MKTREPSRARTVRRSLLIPLLVAPLWAQSPSGAAYSVQVLPGLSEPNYGSAFRINARGEIAGCSMDSNGQVHATLWRCGPGGAGKPSDLGTLGGAYSCAYGLNDCGDVVGESATATQAIHAFLWRDGAMIDLGTMLTDRDEQPGANLSAAFAINARGQAVGWSRTDDGVYRACLWHDGMQFDLGSLGPPGGQFSSAADINARGDIVGLSLFDPDGSGAVRWRRGQILPLGSPLDTAVAINARGDIAGRTASPTGTNAYVLRSGVLTLLGSAESIAGGINDRGDVVGYDVTILDPGTPDGRFQWAFLWRDGKLSELPRPEGARDWMAQSINACGSIVGSMTNAADSFPRPVLWTDDRGP